MTEQDKARSEVTGPERENVGSETKIILEGKAKYSKIECSSYS